MSDPDDHEVTIIENTWEYIEYDRVLTAEELDIVHEWFAARYGIKVRPVVRTERRKDKPMTDTPYEPFDQDRRLPPPPWTEDDPVVRAWERAHGHDVRLKCYVEFGCQVIEPTLEREIERLKDEVTVLSEASLTRIAELEQELHQAKAEWFEEKKRARELEKEIAVLKGGLAIDMSREDKP